MPTMDWEESDAGYELRSLHITVINMLNTDILTEIIIAHSRQLIRMLTCFWLLKKHIRYAKSDW